MKQVPEKDKWLHFTAGMFMSVLFGMYNPKVGLVVAVILGILKEVRDKEDYGVFDWKDTVATWLGGFAGYIVTSLIDIIFLTGT